MKIIKIILFLLIIFAVNILLFYYVMDQGIGKAAILALTTLPVFIYMLYVGYKKKSGKEEE